jgi:hypothetical protein
LVLFRENLTIKKYYRKIKATDEPSAENKQSLQQLIKIKNEITNLFEKGKIREDEYKKLEDLILEHMNKIKSQLSET